MHVKRVEHLDQPQLHHEEHVDHPQARHDKIADVFHIHYVKLAHQLEVQHVEQQVVQVLHHPLEPILIMFNLLTHMTVVVQVLRHGRHALVGHAGGPVAGALLLRLQPVGRTADRSAALLLLPGLHRHRGQAAVVGVPVRVPLEQGAARARHTGSVPAPATCHQQGVARVHVPALRRLPGLPVHTHLCERLGLEALKNSTTFNHILGLSLLLHIRLTIVSFVVLRL